jgi:hypothetical protein
MKGYILACSLLLLGIPLAGAEDDEFITIHEFKNQKGVSLGQLQVRYISSDVFNSLRIVRTKGKQEEILYRIDKSMFYSWDALEQEVSDPNFYGYKIADLTAEQVVLDYVRKKSKTISNNIILQWDADSALFHKRWVRL